MWSMGVLLGSEVGGVGHLETIVYLIALATDE